MLKVNCAAETLAVMMVDEKGLEKVERMDALKVASKVVHSAVLMEYYLVV